MYRVSVLECLSCLVRCSKTTGSLRAMFSSSGVGLSSYRSLLEQIVRMRRRRVQVGLNSATLEVIDWKALSSSWRASSDRQPHADSSSSRRLGADESRIRSSAWHAKTDSFTSMLSLIVRVCLASMMLVRVVGWPY